MTLFLVSVAVVIVVSALCSLTEAAIYAVSPTYVRQLVTRGLRSGHRLASFKANMEQPISAILILNTVANTAGAAVAGAQARALFGDASLLWFSALFTLGVLFLSEIIPKIAGVAYNRPVSRFVSAPLALSIRLLFPFVWVSQKISRVLSSGPSSPLAPEEEVHQMARMSAEEGSILPVEAELVKNVLHLDSLRAKDIMTPRSVVYRLSSALSVKDVSRAILDLPHARIPLHAEEDPEDWTGVVLRTTILCELARDRFETPLGKLAKPLTFVPDSIRGDQLLTHFLVCRQHLSGVVDEYGSVVGIVSFEDVLESLLGSEIVDETDSIVDMREAARKKKRKGKTGPPPPPVTPPKA